MTVYFQDFKETGFSTVVPNKYQMYAVENVYIYFQFYNGGILISTSKCSWKINIYEILELNFIYKGNIYTYNQLHSPYAYVIYVIYNST